MSVEVPWPYLLVLFSIKMFCEIVGKVLLAGVPPYVKEGIWTWSVTQNNLIFMLCDICFLIVSLAIPTAVWLLQCIRVGGCGWPNSWRINCTAFPSLQFINKASSSASAAEATTYFNIPVNTNIAPLSGIGCILMGSDPMKY